MKKLLIILLVLSLTACSNNNNNNNNEPDTTSTTSATPTTNACEIGSDCDKEETITNTKDGLKWEILTLTEANQNLDGTKVLFFSFETCPYCMIARPVLEEVMEKYPDIDIYYVDVQRDERDETNEEYIKMLEYLKPKLADIYSDKIYMPTIAFIKDGELVDTYTGNLDLDGDEKTYTGEEKNEQAKVYEEYLNLLK